MEREQSVPSTAVKRRKRYAKLPKQTPEGKALEDRFVRECATGEALLILFGEVKRGGYVYAGSYRGSFFAALLRRPNDGAGGVNAVSVWGQDDPMVALKRLAYRWDAVMRYSWVPGDWIAVADASDVADLSMERDRWIH